MNKWLIISIAFAMLLLIEYQIHKILKEQKILLGDRIKDYVDGVIRTSVRHARQEIIDIRKLDLAQCQVTILGEYEFGEYTRPGVLGEYIELQRGWEHTLKNSPDVTFTAKCWFLSAPLDCTVVGFTLGADHVLLAPGSARFGLLNHKMTPANKYTITVKRS